MSIAYLEVVRRKRCQIILVILQISSRNFVKVVPKNDLLMKIQLVAFITSLLLGGLKVGSLALNSYVPLGFAVLDASETTICKFNVPSPVVGEHLQRKVLSNN